VRRRARLLLHHIQALIAEGVLQYGAQRVARYLRLDLPGTEPGAADITAAMGSTRPAQGDTSAAAPVFSRFLRHLAYLELAPTTVPLPEMHWFPPMSAEAPAERPAEAPAETEA
jgi:hypothetical protein